MQRIDNNGPESSFNIPLVPYSTNTGSVVINSEAVLKSESVRFQFLQVYFKLLFFFSKILFSFFRENTQELSDALYFKCS